MAAGAPALPIGTDPLIAEAKDRARRRRVAVIAVLAGASLATGLALALRPPGAPAARTVDSAGIHFRLPGGWYVTNRPLTNVTWPVQRLVVSSFPVSLAGSAVGDYTPPQSGVLAQIVEEAPPLSGEHWQARPAHLRLRHLGVMKLFGGNRWDELLFRVHGRHLYAFVWIGRAAPASDRDRLLSLLERMTVR